MFVRSALWTDWLETYMKKLLKILLLVLVSITGTACSLNKMVVRLSMPVIEARISALFQEDDYEMVRLSFPSSIKSLESLLMNDPNNQRLHEFTAYAYYSYAFAFVEDEDRQRASRLYYRCLQHGKQALQQQGIDDRHINGPTDDLRQAIDKLDRQAAEALFWTALCWAKIIEFNRDQLLNILQWHKAVMMMEKVHKLDEHIYLDGPNLFFGVYYGSRSPLLGGDYALSEQYFRQARLASGETLLIADLLQAQYLERQRQDRAAFRRKLKAIINAPEGLSKKYALVNVVARRKAKFLLAREQQWF